jgi:hypothetical protein
MNGLRLDRRADAMRGGYSGPAIVAGNSAKSTLVDRITSSKAGYRMPPAGPMLGAAEVALIRKWIDEGAVWPEEAPAQETRRSEHWAFQAVTRPEVPAIRGAQRVRNPIDAFVLARLEKEGVAPSEEADRATLLRRASLDLTGLPPDPRDVADFLADKRPDAYERQVDRLLRSPQYGEKWARHWLDAARYADSDGYEKDLARPYAYRYRDWVIRALNEDMPFDQFTIEQIAGDLLPGAGVEQRMATGFHRNTLTNREGGIDREELRTEQAVDRINTIGSVWLGLTVGCAQCHDHKYDPISQKEYYQLLAFVNSLEETDIDAPSEGERGPYLAAYPEYRAKRDKLLEQYGVAPLMTEWEPRVRLAAKNQGQYGGHWDLAWTVLWNDERKILFQEPEKRTQKDQDKLTDHFLEWYSAVVTKERYEELKFKELREKLDQLRKGLPSYAQAQTVEDLEERRQTHVLVRGDFRRKGIPVEPGTLAVLHPFEGGARANRLDLARWIVDPANPLTRRVIVNRAWQEFFGRGLVRTSEDFGKQGERPSHAELLDWLASDFVASGWSLKHLHRTIVTSATYRQSSAGRADLRDRDPDNVLLARQSRLRMPAELIRDAALTASGLLNPAVGGPSVRPPQPEGVAEITYGTFGSWKEDTGPARYRRGLYVHFQRSSPYPTLLNFDAPDSNVTCLRRRRSNTPLQALNLLNDPVFVEASRALALRVLNAPPSERTGRLYRLCVGRAPSDREAALVSDYINEQRRILSNEPKQTAALAPFVPDGATQLDTAVWTGASRLVLNLDEFITRE